MMTSIKICYVARVAAIGKQLFRDCRALARVCAVHISCFFYRCFSNSVLKSPRLIARVMYHGAARAAYKLEVAWMVSEQLVVMD